MESGKPGVLFITYHLPLADEPGAFRPWMEARLMQRAGYDVTVVTSGVQYMTGQDLRKTKGWVSVEEVEGVRILRTWAPTAHRRSLARRALNYASFALLAGCASLVKVGRVQRVFAATDPIVVAPMIYLLTLFKGARLVLDERDLYPETAVALGVLKEGAFTRAVFLFQQFLRNRAAAIVAATPGIRAALCRYGHAPEKVRLLYNADVFLDEEHGASRAEAIYARPQGKFLVGYAGGLGMANDIHTLLRAARRLTERDEVLFVIAGAGERRADYERYCAGHGMGNVQFLGALRRPAARDMLSKMDVCVQPLPADPHFSGTLTSKTFDYHGLGVPMIACAEGDTAALLAESGGGVAVPPGDDEALAREIVRLHDAPDLRAALGRAARAWYERHVSRPGAVSVMRMALG